MKVAKTVDLTDKSKGGAEMPKQAERVSIQNSSQSDVKPIYQDAIVQVPRRLSVKTFAEQFYDGKINGVYKLIFNASETGFDKCIRRIGKKIWLDVPEYLAWQDRINGIEV